MCTKYQQLSNFTLTNCIRRNYNEIQILINFSFLLGFFMGQKLPGLKDLLNKNIYMLFNTIPSINSRFFSDDTDIVKPI